MPQRIPKKEAELFDAIRDPEVENILLNYDETSGSTLVIFADHSEEQDESQLEPLYVRATPEVMEKLGLSTNEVEGQGRVVQAPQKKRWKG